ncbi:hypothetical protein RhiirA5_419034 [Rhizophagus irregularis]|uniref:Uncharacterized protein n=1 Tax=Rhizophagus irregularis TaxID=588596 RepID=A0A2N0PJ19_9GLOM|nr:hypothetical protein RhiirA5_419034 [Rhizophagus irregularis]
MTPTNIEIDRAIDTVAFSATVPMNTFQFSFNSAESPILPFYHTVENFNPRPSSVHVPTELIPFIPKRPIYSNSGHTYYPPVWAIDNRNQQLKNEQYSKKEPNFTVRVLKTRTPEPLYR